MMRREEMFYLYIFPRKKSMTAKSKEKLKRVITRPYLKYIGKINRPKAYMLPFNYKVLKELFIQKFMMNDFFTNTQTLSILKRTFRNSNLSPNCM